MSNQGHAYAFAWFGEFRDYLLCLGAEQWRSAGFWPTHKARHPRIAAVAEVEAGCRIACSMLALRLVAKGLLA